MTRRKTIREWLEDQDDSTAQFIVLFVIAVIGFLLTNSYLKRNIGTFIIIAIVAIILRGVKKRVDEEDDFRRIRRLGY